MPKSPDTLYLQRIGNRWYARIPVPSRLRKAMGPYFRRALDTSDITEARMRRWDVLQLAKQEFERREAVGKEAVGKAVSLSQASYAEFRAKLRCDFGDPCALVDAAGDQMTHPGLDALIDKLEDAGLPEDAPAIAAIRDHLSGKRTVTEVLDDYLMKNPKRSATTEANYRTAVKLWVDHHGEGPISTATRRTALAWLEDAAVGKARDTVKRYVTVMSHLWDWEHRAEDEPPTNPFGKLQQVAWNRGRESEDYLPFDDDELKKVFAALEANPQLRSVALVSLYSGMRLSECLAATKVVHDGIECWQVTKGKTKNASRIVPVHPRLAGVELPNNVKASALSVAFGRMGNKLHLPPRKVFHSFRGNFATALERTGCPEEVAVRLLGHKPMSLSYGLYSAGRLASELQVWVRRVSFPSEGNGAEI